MAPPTILMFFILAVTDSALSGTVIRESMNLVQLLGGNPGPDVVFTNFTFDDTALTVNFEVTMEYSQPETLHIFVSNQTQALTEIQLSFANKTATTIIYSAPYNELKRSSDSATLTSQISKTWKGDVSCENKYLPNSPYKYSMAAQLVVGEMKYYMSFYSINNAPISIPDMMVLDRYKVIGAKY